MKKLKKVLLMVMSLMVMFAFTACAKGTEKIKINSDGSATVSAEFLIDKKEYLNYMKDWYKEQTGKTITKKELEELDEDMLSQYKLVKKDGKEYYSQKETKKFSNKEVNKVINDDAVGYVKSNVFYYSSKSYNDNEIDEMIKNNQISKNDVDSIIKFTYQVEFTKPIKSVVGGKISSKNNKLVTFEPSYGKPITMFATTLSNMNVKSVKAKIKELNTVAKTKFTKKTAKKTSIELGVQKVKDASKYQIMYSTNKDFKNSKIRTVTSTKATLNGLKSNTKYYVRVRAAKKNYADKLVYSDWTSTSIKTTK